MELEITWGRVVRVWWAYCWRNLIAIVVAMILGGIVGFIIGFMMTMLGASITEVQYVTAPLGALIGLALSVIPMKMILGKDFGEFRLALISKTNFNKE
jgi:xanthine/uracil permease